MDISVVIPCYNAAEWLPKTIPRIVDSLSSAKIAKAEIIIVDDGSSDNSYQVAKNLKATYPIKVIKQENQGRFLARKNGIDSAKYEYILLVDTRVFIDKKSIQYLVSEIKSNPQKLVWNGHVNVHKKGNIIARFMDTVTNIGWRRYFSNPRTCDYGIEDFDYYPKGTGCFFTKKDILEQAIKQFMKETKDIKNSSDDTLLIRIIAGKYRINLSPKFSCTYFARNTVKQFIPHTFNRGKFFVDGFLKKGTRFYRPLQAILILTPVWILASIFSPIIVLYTVALFLILWVLELIVVLALKISAADAMSFWFLTPLFALFYFAGIWKAFINLLVKEFK